MVQEVVKDELEQLADIFWSHINKHREYISHGEMQMGVADMLIENGEPVGVPSADGRERWMKYINEKFDSPDAAVFKTCDGDVISGFCVAEITDDGADPFGMVCDVLVKEEYRGSGLGGELLAAAIAWLKGRGIKSVYLESGLRNASAHAFFEKRGFVHISEIYRLVDFP